MRQAGLPGAEVLLCLSPSLSAQPGPFRSAVGASSRPRASSKNFSSGPRTGCRKLPTLVWGAQACRWGRFREHPGASYAK